MGFADFTAYQENCNRCSQCKFVPMPASHEFSSICPSIDYGNFHAYIGSGKVITGYAVTHGAAPVTPAGGDSVYACTMCGGCDIACKTNLGDEVEPLESIYELRAIMAQGGHVPPPLTAMIERLRSEGSHLGSSAARSRWAEGLGIRNATEETVDVLLHVDGENAFDEAQWPQLRALVRLLQAANVDFGIAYDAERDSGAFAFDLGFRDDALSLARQQRALLRQSGASVLLAASASAYTAFGNFYSRLGVPLEAHIAHSTDFVAQLIVDGHLKLTAAGAVRATYHDPCKLGRLSEPYKPWSGARITVLNTLQVPDSPRPPRFGTKGQYAGPRQLLRAVEGLELIEMERNREFAFCCGAGAGVPEAYPDMAEMAGLSCLKEARKTGATHLVNACAACQRHLAATAAAYGVPIEGCGVFDLPQERRGEHDDAPLLLSQRKGADRLRRLHPGESHHRSVRPRLQQCEQMDAAGEEHVRSEEPFRLKSTTSRRKRGGSPRSGRSPSASCSSPGSHRYFAACWQRWVER